MSTRAIETRYAGHLFRSRLEARWAALFDLVGWEWVYEPFDGAGYLPDFLIQGEYPVLVEVKPATTLEDMKRHVEKIDAGLPDWSGDVLIVGSVPAMPSAYYDPARNPTIGLLGEGGYDDNGIPTEGGTTRAWDEGAWRACESCRRVGFAHSVQSFKCRPCGHYDGGGPGGPVVNINELWGQAHEATRWSP